MKTKEISITMSRKLTTNVRFEDVFFSHGEVAELDENDDYQKCVKEVQARVAKRLIEQEKTIKDNLLKAAEEALRKI